MMTVHVKRLDEIEYFQHGAKTDAEVFDLMEQATSRPGGLRMLVERYGGSYNPIFARSLSFLLAQVTSPATERTWSDVFAFLVQFKCADDESTLLNSLTAMERLCIFRIPWKTPSALLPSSILCRFLMHSMEGSLLVKRGVIALLASMYWANLLTEAFDATEINILRDRLNQLSDLHNEMLDYELQGLDDFMAGTKTADQHPHG